MEEFQEYFVNTFRPFFGYNNFKILVNSWPFGHAGDKIEKNSRNSIVYQVNLFQLKDIQR